MQVSVIICTHNPRPNYLHRVLGALKAQTLPKERWELLLIDNASEQRLAASWDLSWHPNSRHLREEALGLTSARLCGIRNSTGDLLIFVDDDNVLDPTYLDEALRIAEFHPRVGVWCGSIRGEFETTPPAGFEPYQKILAIEEILQDRWANYPRAWEAEPCGAGMCVRRVVVERYQAEIVKHPERGSLGRKGQQLISGEDTDIAWTGCSMGLGMGRFSRLKLTHLIPSHRLTSDYLSSLFESIAYSGCLLRFYRGEALAPPILTVKSRLSFFYNWLTLRGIARLSYMAQRRGAASGWKLLRQQILKHVTR